MSTFLNTEHRQLLLDSAITPEVIEASGIRSTPKGIDFPWFDGNGEVIWQSRPDVPPLDENGKPIKYLFPKGARVPFHKLRDEDDTSPIAIIEGTKQSYAGLSYAPANMAVYAESGCWGWKHADLSVVDGRDVFLVLDADVDTNPDVYAAAEAMTKALKLNGAKSVHYVPTTGTDKDGLDDALAALPEERRAHLFKTWLSQAPAKLGKRPKGKTPTATEAEADAAKLFRVRDKPFRFQPKDGALMVLDAYPAAIGRDKEIALYVNGAYSVDPDAVRRVLALKLGNMYEPAHVASTTHQLDAILHDGGHVLPERAAEPLMNCLSGMVDLRTGELVDHDPKFLSFVQMAVTYAPDMPTPVYDAWLRSVLRKPGASDASVEALIADLEETAGTMLDPSKTPSKAVFLFGPSRSGKSTFLRLLKAVAGRANTSAVTLHQLSDDVFASANLYGKSLNVAADLSSRDVRDLSAFKMLSGEDEVQANRKYGAQFPFTNQALFAFSANELPTVSEASRAYAERMKPFNFPNSFAGSEDKTLESKLMAELPGILARWVKAYGRMLSRGGYAASDAVTAAEFEAKSDRVAMFVRDRCTVADAEYGKSLPVDQCTTRKAVYEAFAEWVEGNGGKAMGRTAFNDRLSKISGLVDVKNPKRVRCINLAVKPDVDELWALEGDATDEPGSDPWTAPVADEPTPELVAAVDAVYAPGPDDVFAEDGTYLFSLPSRIETAAEPVAAGPSFLDFNTDPETGQDYFA